MARKTGNCPACGGDVEFRSLTSLVTVCPYCHSVVARNDRQLSDQGKIAEIVDSQSPLQLGVRGVWLGKSFRLIGRVQYQHSAGGVWDEWYASFSDQKWGWLSEAQGRFGMMLARPVKSPDEVHAIESLTAGQTLTLENKFRLQVNEVGNAVVAAAEGELPFNPIMQSQHRFVDLEGQRGELATIEYSGPQPLVFLGQAATLTELGLMDAALKQEATKAVGALQLNCPKCAGPLELVQPDAAQRVTCPSCRSLLDVEGKRLEYLSTLKPPRPALKIPLGTKGTLRGVEYQVLGYMRRSVTYDHDYFWQEYLLYSPRHGYTWLVESDDHWSCGRSIPSGSLQNSARGVLYEGNSYRLFQRAKATVRQVWGEFYWKVAINEQVFLSDYIRPPHALSVETTTDPGEDGRNPASEINATLSEYLTHAEIEKAFQLPHLPRGWGVAPNQPNPVTAGVYLQWMLFLVAVGAIHMLWPVITTHQVDFGFTLATMAMLSAIPIGSMVYSWSFEVRRWQDSDFSPYSTGSGEE